MMELSGSELEEFVVEQQEREQRLREFEIRGTEARTRTQAADERD